MTSIAVTGASGFVGGFIYELEGYSKLAMGRSAPKGLSLDYVFLDLEDANFNVTKYLDEIDCVIHCAGLVHGAQGDFKVINTDATVRLARQASSAGVKKFIFISSITRFGIQTGLIHRSCPSNPSDDYGRSKKEAEEELMRLQSKTSMEIISIQAPLLYGPGAPGNFSLLRKIVHFLPVNPFSSIQNQRSLLSIYNLSDFIGYAIDNDIPSGSYLVADSDAISTFDFMQLIAECSGYKRVGFPVPEVLWRMISVLILKRNFFNKAFGDLVVDISDTSAITGWLPPFTVRESVVKTINEEH